jgi:hypothetical protein
MPFEFLLGVLAGLFFLVLAYVIWLKYHEHLHLHRHDHDWRAHNHHLVSVRKIRKRERAKSD